MYFCFSQSYYAHDAARGSSRWLPVWQDRSPQHSPLCNCSLSVGMGMHRSSSGPPDDHAWKGPHRVFSWYLPKVIIINTLHNSFVLSLALFRINYPLWQCKEYPNFKRQQLIMPESKVHQPLPAVLSSDGERHEDQLQSSFSDLISIMSLLVNCTLNMVD